MKPVGVVGLWHLGSTISAAWLTLGHEVRGIEFDPAVAAGLARGEPPLFEPGLAEVFTQALAAGHASFGTDGAAVRGCGVVFIAYDTPVRDDDTCDLAPIWRAVDVIGPHLDHGAIVVVSAQLPVGTARRIRERLRERDASIDVVYSPENLRLGEALRCYLDPGHVVIGADSSEAGDAVERLFAPMHARIFRMNLPSAEMTKHCINTFLATSVTLANQWADLCGAVGADFGDVAAVLRADPRIGGRAYITPGIGFSGGTLGRDLRVLEEVSRTTVGGRAPLFGEVWRYNQRRVDIVARRATEILGELDSRRIGLLGMTYKPGTSTLRRSLPLAVAQDLLRRGAAVRAHDPRADWREAVLPDRLQISDSPYAVAESADLLVLLTEWPEYRDLDFARLAGVMARPILLDTKDFLRPRAEQLAVAGLRAVGLASTPVPAR